MSNKFIPICSTCPYCESYSRFIAPDQTIRCECGSVAIIRTERGLRIEECVRGASVNIEIKSVSTYGDTRLQEITQQLSKEAETRPSP